MILVFSRKLESLVFGTLYDEVSNTTLGQLSYLGQTDNGPSRDNFPEILCTRSCQYCGKYFVNKALSNYVRLFALLSAFWNIVIIIIFTLEVATVLSHSSF